MNIEDLLKYPNKASKFGVEVWTEGEFQVYKYEQLYEMFKGDYSVSRITKVEFEYVHKSNFSEWRRAVRDEVFQSLKEVREALADGAKLCKIVEAVWDTEKYTGGYNVT